MDASAAMVGWVKGHAAPDVLLATIRDFADRTGALRVAVLLDLGPGKSTPTIEAGPGEPLTIEQGEDNYIVPPVELVGVMPLEIDTPKAVPATALNFDPIKEELEAPLGAVEALARAVQDLAAAMGGRSVALAEFGTRSGDPLAVAARPGDPVVISSGEHQFEL
jgi:hypothetical protein